MNKMRPFFCCSLALNVRILKDIGIGGKTRITHMELDGKKLKVIT
jgi:hypothetical protein